jgi:hypothetical protein
MGGKQGAKSDKATEIAERYHEDFMSQLDGRVRVARTLRDRLRALTNDLGGVGGLSYQELSLCKRAVYLERLIEKKELSLAHNGTIDQNLYFSAINSLSALFNRLGLKRRPKLLNGVNTLAELLSQEEPAP